ncbi:hypothetical protein M2390_000831 [Mycetocola sp. BIGb0189]|uniref:Ig-like domain-containing protein n=1 Tax=Mycetocola sp. BIGb0189 TaxID=2940604 RepID=UPI00216707CC|nr:Ig-like domain-containing protein [Mycetocola sp. BIGb0189]MCS4275670.1 hypothetical protein [Mycetocola sp. BIGb0189]
MTMRKTLATAALCAAALTPMLAQPAFAVSNPDTATAQAAATDTAFGSLPVSFSVFQGKTTSNGPRLTKPVTGQLRITLPTGMTITSLGGLDCQLSDGGRVALCGEDDTVWSGSPRVEFGWDGVTTPGNRTDGLFEILRGGQRVDSFAFSGTVKASLELFNPIINAGAEGTLDTHYTTSLRGDHVYTAPAGTTFTGSNNPRCSISADGRTATCADVTASPTMPLSLTLRVDESIVPGTVLSGGSARVTKNGVLLSAATFTVTVDGATVAPTVSGPAHGSTNTTNPVTFGGTGVPGARITVAGTTRTVCTTTVNATGTWSCDATFALPNGRYDLTVTQRSGAVDSTTTVSFTQAVPTITTPVAITGPSSDAAQPVGRPTFTGTGHPGAAIRVFGTSRTVATTTVNADGTWSVPAQFDLSAGRYVLSVEQKNGTAAPQIISHAFSIATR